MTNDPAMLRSTAIESLVTTIKLASIYMDLQDPGKGEDVVGVGIGSLSHLGVSTAELRTAIQKVMPQ